MGGCVAIADFNLDALWWARARSQQVSTDTRHAVAMEQGPVEIVIVLLIALLPFKTL